MVLLRMESIGSCNIRWVDYLNEIDMPLLILITPTPHPHNPQIVFDILWLWKLYFIIFHILLKLS